MLCLSQEICLSVCRPTTQSKTAKRIGLEYFTTLYFFLETKRRCEIPTGHQWNVKYTRGRGA